MSKVLTSEALAEPLRTARPPSLPFRKPTVLGEPGGSAASRTGSWRGFARASSVLLTLFLFTIDPVCAASTDAASTDAAISGVLSLQGTQTVPLGEIPSYGTTNHLFRIRNTGNAPLKITRLMPTCTCVKGSIDKEILAPGEEATVVFTLIASEVRGTFKRSMWIQTDAERNGFILVAVTGSVRPLFTGLPNMPIRLMSSDQGTIWTNHYTLIATEAGIALGTPEVVTNAMRMTCSVETNRNTTNTAYDITLITEPLEAGKSMARVVLPALVAGRDDVPPVVFVFHAEAGISLRAIPSTVVLYKTGSPLKRRLRIITRDQNVEAQHLTWEPAIEGVSIDVSESGGLGRRGNMASSRGTTSLNVMLALSPNAVETLLKQEQAQLTFRYKDHQPVTVTFSEAQAKPSSTPGDEQEE